MALASASFVFLSPTWTRMISFMFLVCGPVALPVLSPDCDFKGVWALCIMSQWPLHLHLLQAGGCRFGIDFINSVATLATVLAVGMTITDVK